MKIRPKNLIYCGLLLAFLGAVLNPMGRRMVYLKDAGGNFILDEKGERIISSLALSTEQIIYENLVYLGFIIFVVGLCLFLWTTFTDFRKKQTQATET